VLERLAEAAPLVVASHHVVLATLLRQRLQAVRLVRAAGGAARLEPGVLEAPNGLAMMGRLGVADAVRDRAAQVHGWLAARAAAPAGLPRR
jgi:hypothetical protein